MQATVLMIPSGEVIYLPVKAYSTVYGTVYVTASSTVFKQYIENYFTTSFTLIHMNSVIMKFLHASLEGN